MRELPISAEILEDLLTQGAEHYLYVRSPSNGPKQHVRVEVGPDSSAEIIGVRYDFPMRAVVLIYDRDIPDNSSVLRMIEP